MTYEDPFNLLRPVRAVPYVIACLVMMALLCGVIVLFFHAPQEQPQQLLRVPEELWGDYFRYGELEGKWSIGSRPSSKLAITITDFFISEEEWSKFQTWRARSAITTPGPESPVAPVP